MTLSDHCLRKLTDPYFLLVQGQVGSGLGRPEFSKGSSKFVGSFPFPGNEKFKVRTCYLVN